MVTVDIKKIKCLTDIYMTFPASKNRSSLQRIRRGSAAANEEDGIRWPTWTVGAGHDAERVPRALALFEVVAQALTTSVGHQNGQASIQEKDAGAT
jgi:hypothetical protein